MYVSEECKLTDALPEACFLKKKESNIEKIS
jgi:hypothetical protein